MSEDALAKKEVHAKYKTIDQAFEKVVGFELPNSPDQMSNEVNLPLIATGDFFQALKDQNNVDHRYSEGGLPKERSQAVGILERDGNLYNRKVIVGNPTNTGLDDGASIISRWLRPILSKEPTPLTYWHIHTKRHEEKDSTGDTYYAGGDILGTGDIAQRIGQDRLSLIYLLGAPEGIKVIFQTKMAQRKGLVLSTFLNISKEMDKIYKFYNNRHFNPDESALSQYLEEKGYVLYGWKKNTPEDTVLDAYNRGVFKDGIKLNRIGQPLWLRNIEEITK